MIHVFFQNGQHIALDVNTGNIFLLDEITGKMLESFPHRPPTLAEAAAQLADLYPENTVNEATITEAYAELQTLIDQKMLYSPDFIDDKKEKMIAAIDGEPSFVGRKISVLNVHQIPGNVGYATGNIEFAGSVVVRGDIENGFVVRAEGDVTVGGNVEGGSVYAGGNVTIRGGIAGQDRTVIECKGNLYARYIDHARIEVEGEIKGRDAILHSQVNAGQRITLESRKGMVMGGVVRARDEINVQVLGSKMGTATEVEVGASPAMRKELIEVEKKVAAMEKELDKVEKALVILNKMGFDLPPEREELKARLTRTSFYLKAELKKHTTRRDELNEEVTGRQAERGRIKVRQRIYPGVKVIIGNAVRIFKDEVHYAVLTYDEGEVEVQAYR